MTAVTSMAALSSALGNRRNETRTTSRLRHDDQGATTRKPSSLIWNELYGGRGGNRTHNLSIKSRMLCQLSYTSKRSNIIRAEEMERHESGAQIHSATTLKNITQSRPDPKREKRRSLGRRVSDCE